MNVQSEIIKLTDTKRKLEGQLHNNRKRLYELIRAQAGVDTFDDLIMELREYASPDLQHRLAKTPTKKMPTARTEYAIGQNKVHARFDKSLMERVRADIETGEMSMEELAAKYAPSPSIYTLRIWKRKWGLTKHYGRRAKDRRSGGK